MINPKHTHAVLKINGVDTTASDEVIFSTLISANYTEDEAKEALTALRNNLEGPGTVRVDGLHKVFYTDNRLRPTEVSGLLGIDIELSAPIGSLRPKGPITALQLLTAAMLSILIALVGLIIYMYLNEMGIFHPLLALDPIPTSSAAQ